MLGPFMLKKILLAVLIPLFLTGCLTQSLAINPSLIKNCDDPELQGNTWRDVGILAREQGASIDECNIRLEGIREALGHDASSKKD